MIPANIESSSITIEKNAESIIDWFERHKQSFYTLGWSYLRNQLQMEELFYQSILKIQKEMRRSKSASSSETWVRSIFIHTCRELSANNSFQASEESEPPRQDFFKTLDRIEESEREAVIFTYVVGIPKEEAAELLQVSAEKLNELLVSGVGYIRKEWGYGSDFNGCKEYRKDYFNYLEKTMERSEKIDFEIHIYHCRDCQEDLATFQEVMFDLAEKMEALPVPADFIENVKARLIEKEKQRQQKVQRHTRMGFIFAGVFALFISVGVYTGMFRHVYYTWTEDNPELRAYLQAELGERLKLEAESGGVKIKITGAIADEVQTLVFYEIEDTRKDNQYVLNEQGGVFVENQFKLMNVKNVPRYYAPDLESDVNSNEKNVYRGKISLRPLSKENGTIKLKITSLLKLDHDSADRHSVNAFEKLEYKAGEWKFEVPVTKQPSIEFALKQKTEVEGVPVYLDKLIMAPTLTILQYEVKNVDTVKWIENLHVDYLEVNHKKVKADIYGNAYLPSKYDKNGVTFQTGFDSVQGEKPEEVNVHFSLVNLSVRDRKTIELDAAKGYPQTFEYAGSTISIDSLEDKESTEVVISNREVKGRAFEWFQFDIRGEDGSQPITTEVNSQGVLVDKNGKVYEENGVPIVLEELDQPRYFTTVQSMKYFSETLDNFIPKSIEIFGYNTTKYLDKLVEISVQRDGSRASNLSVE